MKVTPELKAALLKATPGAFVLVIDLHTHAQGDAENHLAEVGVVNMALSDAQQKIGVHQHNRPADRTLVDRNGNIIGEWEFVGTARNTPTGREHIHDVMTKRAVKEAKAQAAA